MRIAVTSASSLAVSSLLGISNPYSGLQRRSAATPAHASSELLVEGFAKGLSVNANPLLESTSRSSRDGSKGPDSVLDRIDRLIGVIGGKALQSAASETSGASQAASGQRAIDEALMEIGRLIGMPLRLGGVERAVVSGVNDEQIEAYEILFLRPNAQLGLSGSLHGARQRAASNLPAFGGLGSLSVSTDLVGVNGSQIAALSTGSLLPDTVTTISGSVDAVRTPAELVYEGSPGAVVSGTASFRLTGPQGSANISITSGEALSNVVQRINDQTAATGVVAAVQGNSLTLFTLAVGAAAEIVIDNIQRESLVSVSGVNGGQIDNFQVVSIPDETGITLNGTVTQAATRATLTYLGGNGGVVVDSATFTLTGDLGSVPISIVQGESLGGVADRINQLSGTTGVSGAVSSDDLVLSSVSPGSAANVAVELTEIAQYLNVAGVNASQITNFQVLSAEPDSVNTLSGSVTQVATKAQLTYAGTPGSRVVASATFTLTGSLGSAVISVNALEALTAARDRINQQTATTGVTASVSGDNLLLTSSGVGTAATVAVAATSGVFSVTGGNGNGTANGTNAQLTINSQAVVAAGNNVTFANAMGSYSFTLVSGFTGAFSTITVTSSNGTFDVAGGDGDGTAAGSDAEATINGQPLVAAGNTFTINSGGGQFVLQIADGFAAVLNQIVVTSIFADFTITGGNGNATANGSEAQATINGQSLTSASGSFTVSTPAGNLVIGFLDSFLGAFDPFTITVRRQRTALGESRQSTVQGRSSTALLNGQIVHPQNGRFVFNRSGVEIALKFAPGFEGDFDPVTIVAPGDNRQPSNLKLNDTDAARIRSLVAPLFSLASGGENAGLTQNGGRAYRLAEAALRELAALRFGQSAAATPRSLTGGRALLDLIA